MHRTKTLLATVALSALFVAPALAQQTQNETTAGPGRTAPNPAATAASGQSATTTATENGHGTLNGTLVKSHDEWRASKLVGQTVYDENGQSIGTVDDLMLDSSGKVAQAVISVGGFLGIGSKLVAIPFDQLKFEQNSDHAANAATGAATGTGAMVTGTPTTATTANDQSAGNAPMNTVSNVPPGQRTTYYSVVIPGANKNTLTSMSDFRYAS